MPSAKTSVKVLVRFGLRFAVLCLFASMGAIGFARSIAALLWMSTILCVVTGAMRKERPLDSELNHWDEALVYGALCCLASAYNQSMIT